MSSEQQINRYVPNGAVYVVACNGQDTRLDNYLRNDIESVWTSAINLSRRVPHQIGLAIIPILQQLLGIMKVMSSYLGPPQSKNLISLSKYCTIQT